MRSSRIIRGFAVGILTSKHCSQSLQGIAGPLQIENLPSKFQEMAEAVGVELGSIVVCVVLHFTFQILLEVRSHFLLRICW